jgi:hypothetical protein
MIAPTIVSGTEQSDSFAEYTPSIDLLVGLYVRLLNICRCGSTIATAG